eukprot:4524601-Prymnesium_polylepis.1
MENSGREPIAAAAPAAQPVSTTHGGADDDDSQISILSFSTPAEEQPVEETTQCAQRDRSPSMFKNSVINALERLDTKRKVSLAARLSDRQSSDTSVWSLFTSAHEVQIGILFDLFDTDRTGEIDKHEVIEVLDAIGKAVPSDEVKGIFERADSNKDGVITCGEFNQLLAVMLSIEGIDADISDLRHLAGLR